MTDFRHADNPEPFSQYQSSSGKQLLRWSDEAMYMAQPTQHEEDGVIAPRVTLVHMTPKPLQQLAAAARLYEGVVVHDPNEISQNIAYKWLDDMSRTALAMPLEWIDFHFLFEGVTRAWMDQLRTQRTAAYVAESLRFSVKPDVSMEVVMPPSIAKLKDDDPKRRVWDHVVNTIAGGYSSLVNAGVPAEDARGLLPLNIATRIHYKTNLRGLVQHAGMRLCSQAQYEWKEVWAGMIQAILGYGPPEDSWQQQEIVRLFKPVCYRTGRCEFRASTDRACRIRDRVEEHYRRGEPPSMWLDIDALEPLMEGAARKAPDQ